MQDRKVVGLGYVFCLGCLCVFFNFPTMILNVIISVVFVFSYLQNMPVLSEEQREDFTCFENLMTKEFIGQQLILIIDCMDTTEEGGR